MISITYAPGFGPVKEARVGADYPHMGPELTETSRATGCPSCGAALRPGAPWCTLCYTDLRPAPAPEPAPYIEPVLAPSASYGVAARDPLTQPLVEFLPELPGAQPPVAQPPVKPTASPAAVAATWPCTRCDSVNPLSAAVCGICGGPFLSALKGEEPVLVLPLVGDIGAMSRGRRLAVAFGVVLALLLPLILLGMLLSGPAPKTPGAPGSNGGPSSSVGVQPQ